MKWWQRLLIWLVLITVAALVWPGVDPYMPLVLGALLIVAFELAGRPLIRRLRRR
jgi:Sec-independent protein secretion pathway component TatC